MVILKLPCNQLYFEVAKSSTYVTCQCGEVHGATPSKEWGWLEGYDPARLKDEAKIY